MLPRTLASQRSFLGVGVLLVSLLALLPLVALLLVAPKVVADLSWFALVAGFVVTIKVYWLAMLLGWMKPKSSSNFN